uniref:Uncharacterized protein n=1 Tax=Anguilla anguilla TaxID=7936 RepID=A0A0E9X396_ANGAN
MKRAGAIQFGNQAVNILNSQVLKNLHKSTKTKKTNKKHTQENPYGKIWHFGLNACFLIGAFMAFQTNGLLIYRTTTDRVT